MVDTKEAMESEFLSVDFVEKSLTKKCVVVDPGTYETDQNGKNRLTVKVNIDGKTKKWRPNRSTVENLQVLGSDSIGWVGKVIVLSIETHGGRKMVIGKPSGEINNSVRMPMHPLYESREAEVEEVRT